MDPRGRRVAPAYDMIARMCRWWVALCAIVCVGRPAFADDPAVLTTQGEALARTGEFSRAIEMFKRADAIAPSAKLQCEIGLVYTRREAWSQAEIFLDRCKQRASATDPLPDWFAEATAQLAQKLHGVDVAELEVDVSPPGTAALITVSTFPPDETFEPRTIHLVAGTYVIAATAPGHRSASETVTVKLGAKTVVKLVLPELAKPSPPPPPPNPTRWTTLERGLLLGAAGVAVAGIVFHADAAIEHGHLTDAVNANVPADWDAHQGSFETARSVAIGCYTVAVLAATVGLVLHLSHPERAPVVTGSIGQGTAMIGIELRR